MRTFRAALFDLDGTLLLTEKQYTAFWDRMKDKYRPDVPDLAFQIKGTTLLQTFDMFFPDRQVQDELRAEVNRFEAQMDYPIIAGAVDFIRSLKAHGVKVAVVTSSNQIKMGAVHRAIPEFMGLFDRILTAEDFKASKPDPDCYLVGARVFGLTPDDCVVFEDAKTGLEAATRSGCYTIGLTTGLTPAEIAGRCDYSMPDFREITYEKVLDLIQTDGRKP